MIRIVFILAAIVGVFVVLMTFIPSSGGSVSHHVPWLSWAGAACALTGYIGYKITK